jgi:hypothetical protein
MRAGPCWPAARSRSVASGTVGSGRHVVGLEHRLAGGPVWAVVFGSLADDDWQVPVRHGPSSPVVNFTVTGGPVTTTTLPLGFLSGETRPG